MNVAFRGTLNMIRNRYHIVKVDDPWARAMFLSGTRVSLGWETHLQTPSCCQYGKFHGLGPTTRSHRCAFPFVGWWKRRLYTPQFFASTSWYTYISLAKALSVILSPTNSLVTVYFKPNFCFDASPLYMGVGEINIGLLAWTAQF